MWIFVAFCFGAWAGCEYGYFMRGVADRWKRENAEWGE